IQRGQLGYLDASEGIGILELPTGKVDRSEGDVHPLGNPHYWLDPRNGLVIARHIANRLKQLDPQNAEQYEKNYQQFETKLKEKMAAWQKQLAPLRGKKIIAYHKSLPYFADWSGIVIAGFVEPKPGIPPNPGHLLSLIDKIKSEKIPLIVSENFYDPKPSEQLAEKTGAKFIVISTSVNGDPSVKTYEDLFEVMIQKLLGAQ
ncbi:MAG: metal ABC transporter substrate-binding protein, partial [Deltaproteobacteria bacterium]|nr:metal ABC transporter substrate-binding protein [Deltaproteobacteria bacterium]